MSRSKNKSGIMKYGSKDYKKFYNRALRRKPIEFEFGNGGWHKKVYNSYNINDQICTIDYIDMEYIKDRIRRKIKHNSNEIIRYDKYTNKEWVEENRPKYPSEQEIMRSYINKRKFDSLLYGNGYEFKLYFLNYEEYCFNHVYDYNDFKYFYIKEYKKYLQKFNKTVDFYKNIKRPAKLTEDMFNAEKMLHVAKAKAYSK